MLRFNKIYLRFRWNEKVSFWFPAFYLFIYLFIFCMLRVFEMCLQKVIIHVPSVHYMSLKLVNTACHLFVKFPLFFPSYVVRVEHFQTLIWKLNSDIYILLCYFHQIWRNLWYMGILILKPLWKLMVWFLKRFDREMVSC